MCMGEGVVAREVTGGEIVGCAGKGEANNEVVKGEIEQKKAKIELVTEKTEQVTKMNEYVVTKNIWQKKTMKNIRQLLKIISIPKHIYF